ncbi:MAG: FHA domain-containing protein, partial [Pseudomonadota bacterium]
TNGTYVNGAPVAERALSDGDVIVIGTHKLRYQPGEDETTSGGPEPTQQLDRREIEKLLVAADARRAESGLKSAGRALNWIAQDEDGIWWGFEHEPHEGGRGWVDDKSGLRIRLKEERLNPNWRTTLQKL